MTGLKIIFAGSGEFGLAVLRSLFASKHQIGLVISQPDRPAGRGRSLTATPIAQEALSRGVALMRTANINDETLPPADLMLVIAFGQKIGQHIVQHPRLGSINLHASRLPRYRGAAPINWAIMNGESVTGNSVIRLAQRMDAGGILAQSSLRIAESETAGELHDRLAIDGVPLVHQVIEELEAGRQIETPQDDSQATTAPKIMRSLARLDFHHSAAELSRRICGLFPWPGCRVRLMDAAGQELSRLRLVRARPVDDEGARWLPGEIMSDGSVHTGNGGLEVLEVQPDGRTSMALSDYRRGHCWQTGSRLEAIE